MSSEILTLVQRQLRRCDSNALLRFYDLAPEIFNKSPLRQERARAAKAVHRIARALVKMNVQL
jgi:hypothetical protein